MNECYPYFRLFQFDDTEQWVMGTYDTCKYSGPTRSYVSVFYQFSVGIFFSEEYIRETARMTDRHSTMQTDRARVCCLTSLNLKIVAVCLCVRHLFSYPFYRVTLSISHHRFCEMFS